MPTRIILSVLAAVVAFGAAALASSSPSVAAQPGEAPRVIKEACGEPPETACMARLQKACRGKVTFRCYYARKRQIDAPGRDTPEKADERDDRSIFYDE